jgi:uncharacterized protein YbjT (DUF2867 family)
MKIVVSGASGQLGRLVAEQLLGQTVWFSPPSQMPLGVAVGTVTLGERLHVALRYRHPQFDRDAAHRFAELYRSVLCS